MIKKFKLVEQFQDMNLSMEMTLDQISYSMLTITNKFLIKEKQLVDHRLKAIVEHLRTN